MTSFVDQFDRLFAGRRDVWSEGFPSEKDPGKYTYRTVYDPLTPELLLEHLKGHVQIGVYPILPDNTVQWFAVDFDPPKGKDTTWQELWKVAKEQQQSFAAAGLVTYLERSRSGKGVHAWAFLEAPVNAAIVRRAVAPLIHRDVSVERWYPIQDVLTERKPLGNLLALPFNGEAVTKGNSVFLDPETSEPIPPREWIQAVQLNSVQLIEDLAGRTQVLDRERVAREYVGQIQYDEELTGALKVLSPYGCQFFRHCYVDRATLREPEWYAGLQIAAHFRGGRDLAHILSRGHSGYDERETNYKFDQALTNERVGCAWIHEHYPQHACTNCPMKAPHWLAKRPMIELVNDQSGDIARAGSFRFDLERVRQLEAGAITSGLKPGIAGMDEVMRFRPGELWIIGGRPSKGKSYLAIHSSIELARSGTRCFVFSTETGERGWRNRYLAHAARVNSRLLRVEGQRKLSTAEWDRLEAASEELASLPLYFDYTTLNTEGMLLQVETALIRERADLDQPFVVWQDYLQFMARNPGEDDYTMVTRLSKELKMLAKVLNNPVVSLSQLNRGAEDDEEGDITAFKGSGQIEQDMDGGIVIVGPRLHGSKAPRKLVWVKQRDDESQMRVPFVLDQTYGYWEYVGGTPAHIDQRPLLELISESQ